MADKISRRVYFNAEGFKQLAEKFQVLGVDTSRLADKTLGNVAAEGRKHLGEAQKRSSGLHMGAEQRKWKKGQFQDFMQYSKYNSTHGWYVSHTGTRIIGFNFENLSYIAGRRTTKYREGSRGYLYSLLANLYSKPVTYKDKASPWFQRRGQLNQKRWRKGETRPAREMSMTVGVVQQGLDTAMVKSRIDADKMLREGGWL